ncbi:MAG: acyl-CoA dehydrogenase family protein, partial [candidate division WOR-3 bacterium]
VLKFGNDELKRQYLPKLALGEIIGGFAEPQLTEVNFKIDGDNVSLNGSSRNIICGAARGLFLLLAREAAGNSKLTAIVVEGSAEGVKIKGKTETSGMRAAGMREVVFENLTVPRRNIIGQVGEGQMIYDAICDRARIGLSAIGLGLSQAAVDSSIKYARTRIQFSEPIINFGMVRSKIAEMVTRTQVIRLLVYDAALKCSQNREFTNESAMAKYLAARFATQNTTDAIQIHGGYGYTKDYPVERYFRDSQICAVICGSSYQDREFIAKRTIG